MHTIRATSDFDGHSPKEVRVRDPQRVTRAMLDRLQPCKIAGDYCQCHLTFTLDGEPARLGYSVWNRSGTITHVRFTPVSVSPSSPPQG